MKALLLLPLHESSEYIAMNLMVALSKKGFDTLSVPSYANYLKEVGLVQNFEQSIFMALTTAKDSALNTPDTIIIGNCDKAVAFDIILNININHEEGVPLVDLQIAKLRELYGADPDLGPIINHLYSVEDAEYAVGGTVEQIAELVSNLCKTKLN